MSVVKFYAIDVVPALNQKTKLKEFIKSIFLKEKKELRKIDIIFCNDNYLLSLNQQFLKHDYFTDILTFNLSENDSSVFGEIYISITRVKDNAIQHMDSYKSELRRVIIHGVLHLCGYTDNTNEKKFLMTEKENFYLKLLEAFHVETR